MKISFKFLAKVSVGFICLCGTTVSAAIPSKAPSKTTSQSASGRAAMRDGVLLNTQFQWSSEAAAGSTKDSSRDVASSVATSGPSSEARELTKWQIDTRVIADLEKKEWVRVGETATGLAILAYVQPLEGEQVKIHARLVDVSKSDERLVSSPAIVTTYGVKAVVQQNESGADKGFSFEVTPSRVRY